MKLPPTLQDLAKQLGLSVATVSLALRGMGNLSDATCEHVCRAAKKKLATVQTLMQRR